MYVKYQLREPKGLVTPKGPTFASARTIISEIDGTVIQFKVPKHRSNFLNDEPVLPRRSYKLDEMLFRSNYQEGFNVTDSWNDYNFFYHTWSFYGPWFTGVLADLEMYFTLVKPDNYENDDFSLFHPRAFEKIVGDYLTNNFSTYKSKTVDIGKHYFVAPVNWQPLSSYPTVAVRLEVIPDLTVITKNSSYYVFFPITNKVMAVIQFIPSQLLALSQEELDKRVDRSSMLELMENIISSIELTLSPEAKAQQKIALAGLNDTSLIKDYPPLKWGESESGESLKTIEENQ